MLCKLNRRSFFVYCSLFGLQALIVVSAIPYFMRTLSQEAFTAIFFLGAGLVSVLSTHVTNRLVGTKTRLSTSLREDALRGVIYLGILFVAAAIAALIGL
jgi:hypothetical protein